MRLIVDIDGHEKHEKQKEKIGINTILSPEGDIFFTEMQESTSKEVSEVVPARKIMRTYGHEFFGRFRDIYENVPELSVENKNEIGYLLSKLSSLKFLTDDESTLFDDNLVLLEKLEQTNLLTMGDATTEISSEISETRTKLERIYHNSNRNNPAIKLMAQFSTIFGDDMDLYRWATDKLVDEYYTNGREIIDAFHESAKIFDKGFRQTMASLHNFDDIEGMGKKDLIDIIFRAINAHQKNKGVRKLLAPNVLAYINIFRKSDEETANGYLATCAISERNEVLEEKYEEYLKKGEAKLAKKDRLVEKKELSEKFSEDFSEYEFETLYHVIKHYSKKKSKFKKLAKMKKEHPEGFRLLIKMKYLYGTDFEILHELKKSFIRVCRDKNSEDLVKETLSKDDKELKEINLNELKTMDIRDFMRGVS